MIWRLLLAWLAFADTLDSLPVGGSTSSPDLVFTYRDGRRFNVSIHAERTG